MMTVSTGGVKGGGSGGDGGGSPNNQQKTSLENLGMVPVNMLGWLDLCRFV